MFKKWLLTTVIAGSLAVCAVGHGAMAQSGSTMLHPNSNWAVSKLAASSAESQPYCAIARRFSNNIVLTVASNAKGESSVAIDFQRETLEKGSNYQVVLDPGLEQHRSYSVRPVSRKAVVVRLGQDVAFHNALQRTGKLGVNLGGQSYSFHLPDAEDGQVQLAGCLADMVQPAAGAPTPLPADSTASQEITEPVIAVQNDVDSRVENNSVEDNSGNGGEPVQNAVQAQTPIQIAQADITSGTGQNVSPARAPEAQEPPPLRIYNEAPAVSQSEQPSVSEHDVMVLREENVRLRNALERERRVYEDRFMQESEGSSQVSELNERLQILERENSTLRFQLSEAADSAAQNAAMAAAQTVSTPVAALSCPETGPDQASLAEIKRQGEAMANVQTEVAALLKENESLNRQIEQQKAEIMLLEQNVASATAAAAASTAAASAAAKNDTEARELAARNATQNLMIERLESRVKSLEEENLALKQTQNDHGGSQAVTLSQLRSLEEQLRYTQEDRDKLARQINSAHDNRGQVRMSIADDNWDLEQATARYNESEREIRRLSRQLAEQRTQCAGEVKQLEYMLFDPDVANEEQVAKLISLEKQLADMTRLYEEKDAQLKANYTSESQVAQPSQEAAIINSKVIMLEQEKAVLEANIRELQDERDHYVQKVGALEAALSSIQTAAGAMPVTASALQPQPLPVNEVQGRAMRVVTSAEDAHHVAGLHQEISYVPAPKTEVVDIARSDRRDQVLDQMVNTQSVAPYAVPVTVIEDAVTLSDRGFMTSQDVMNVLEQANIPVKGTIRTEQIDGGVAYSWDTNNLFGSAEQKPMTDSSAFDDMAKTYLAKTENRCAGEFSAVPVLSMTQSGVVISTYDISCSADEGTASVSVLFFNHNGMFNSFAHETGLETMDMAVEARNALAKLAFSSKIAMR